jgi:hypothetical protein
VCRLGRERLQLGDERAGLVEELFRLVAAHPGFEHSARCGGFVTGSRMGIWWARQEPSTLWPSTFLGPVQPLGVRRTIMGQRGARLA